MPARARMISPGVGAILIITAWLAGQTLLPTEQRAFGDDPAAPQPLRAGGEPAPPCSDDVFLRRLHLDLVGRQPTSAEIEAFMADTSPGKRGAEVDRLLASPAWSQTWARYFRDVILFRRTDPQSAFMQTPLETFLASRLAADASWGAIARDLITATGAPGDHGETAIVMAQMGETADIAAEVSRIFLGIQLQCAQCHDHFTDRWKREQFHEFAVLAGGGVRGGRVVGCTDSRGVDVLERPVTVPDLFSTFCHAMGIDPAVENMAPSGRPVRLVDGGEPVLEIFG